MNIVFKKASALVFSVMVTTSMVGMENENIVEPTTEQVTSAAWYRKSSMQAAAVVITLATVGCVCAVRMGKVGVPAFIAALIVASQAVQDPAPKSDDTHDVSGQIAEGEDQEVSVGETAGALEPTHSSRDLLHEAIDFVKSIKLPTWDQYKTTVENMTTEDFERMNEDLVR